MKIFNIMLWNIRYYTLFVVCSIICASALGQDSTVSAKSVTTTNTTHTNNTDVAVQPWMLIVGGIVLVAIIIALVSGRGNTVERTTVIKD